MAENNIEQDISGKNKEDAIIFQEMKFPVFGGMRLPPFPPLFKNAEERFKAIENLKTRADDIILAAFPRSGTHWMWEILIMLSSGKAEYTTEVKETAFLESVDSLDSLDEKPSPRILNTHVPYRCLPKQYIQNGGKIIHVTRNPKDQMVSFFHFLKKIRKGNADSKWDDHFQQCVNTEGEKMYGGWSAYELEFEEAEKENEAIYSLYYEDLKKNPASEIQKIADFLGLTVSEDMIEDIAHKCSFSNLKNADDTIKESESRGQHYRKGEVGDWRNQFTVAQNEQFDKLYEIEMKNSKLKMKFE